MENNLMEMLKLTSKISLEMRVFKMDDELTAMLREIKPDLPKPRLELSEAEKDRLVQACGGPLTAKNLINAVEALPRQRIAFVFNSIDSQVVVDILANDMKEAIARALSEKSFKNKGLKK